MRKLVIVIFPVIALILLTIPAGADPVGTNDKEIKSLAEPIVDNLLGGFNEGDYAKYSKNFDAAMLEAIPEKKFQQVRQDLLKKLGKFKNKKYLGFLNQGPYTIVLWKGAFSGTKSDILIKLVLSKRQGKVFVAGLWFR